MRGQKRVEDARERAYNPRIHLLHKRVLRRWMDCRVKPGNDNPNWRVPASRGDDVVQHAYSGGGKAIHRRSCMLRWQASAKATSRMPAVKSLASGAPDATWRRNASQPTR